MKGREQQAFSSSVEPPFLLLPGTGTVFPRTYGCNHRFVVVRPDLGFLRTTTNLTNLTNLPFSHLPPYSPVEMHHALDIAVFVRGRKSLKSRVCRSDIFPEQKRRKRMGPAGRRGHRLRQSTLPRRSNPFPQRKRDPQRASTAFLESALRIVRGDHSLTPYLSLGLFLVRFCSDPPGESIRAKELIIL